LRLFPCHDAGDYMRQGRESALFPRASSIHRAVLEDFDEPITKYVILGLPYCLRLSVCRKAHECFRTRRIDGDVGSETLEPGIDRFKRKLVLWDLLGGKGLVAAAFGMKTSYFATVNAWTTAAPAREGVLRSERRAGRARVRRCAACKGPSWQQGRGTYSITVTCALGHRNRPMWYVQNYRTCN